MSYNTSPKRHYCPECNERLSDNSYWCQPCQSCRFSENFGNWTSSSAEIDKFIQQTQLNAKECDQYLEWIPFHSFINVSKYEAAEVGTVFTANWEKGPADTWDEEQFVCKRELTKVALISLGNSAESFLKELNLHYRARLNNGLMIRLFGVTRESITGNFMMVAETVEWDIRHYVSHHYARLTWPQKLAILFTIASALDDKKNHEDDSQQRFDSSQSDAVKSHIELRVNELGLGDCKDLIPTIGYYRYDLLPYFAPEVLILGAKNSLKAEVYSFGMLMWEFASNRPPFYDRPHDAKLIKEIASGLRPNTPSGVPECYAELMKQCWHGEPMFRPTFSQLVETLGSWHLYQKESEAFAKAETRRLREVRARGLNPDGKMLSPPKIHPQAIYTSRLLKFPILPSTTKNRPRRTFTENQESTQQELESMLVRDESFFTCKSLMQPRLFYPDPEPENNDDLEKQYLLSIPIDCQLEILACAS